jgi:hypothetical protein
VAELIEMEPAECERLLRRGTFGRVALVRADSPEIVPVNYTVHKDEVVVRTTSDGLLARHGHGRELAFEVDLVDDERWHGWSVVARGVGELVVHPAHPAWEPLLLRPWAAGDRTSELRIAWTELTGRRVGCAWDAEGAMYSRKPTR